MARCLVLGANGFIGSHVVDLLAENGHFIRCFDRYKSNIIQFTNHGHHDVEIFNGDFLSSKSLEEALEGIEYVFHFISTTNPIISEKDPKLDIETNIRYSVELLELCVKKRVKRVIFASTSAIYGDHPEIDAPIQEDTKLQPISPYAIGKLAIEQYFRFFKKKYGLDHLILRVSNPYGARQNILGGQGVIPTFLNCVRNNEPVTIYGDGSMVRDYIFVKDLAKVIAHIFDKETKHSVYNVGSGKGHSVLQIVAAIEKVVGKTLEQQHVEAPASFVKKIILDTTRLESEFGVHCNTTLEEGIEKTWERIQETQQPEQIETNGK